MSEGMNQCYSFSKWLASCFNTFSWIIHFSPLIWNASFYDIRNYFVELGRLLLFLLFHWSFPFFCWKNNSTGIQHCPKSLFLFLSNCIYPFSAVCHAFPLSSVPNTPPTTCIRHVRGISSPFLHKGCFHTCSQGRGIGYEER